MNWAIFDMGVQDGSTQGHYWLLAVSRVRYSLILDFRQTKFSSHESYAVVHDGSLSQLEIQTMDLQFG